jgi:hypothetical protein
VSFNQAPGACLSLPRHDRCLMPKTIDIYRSSISSKMNLTLRRAAIDILGAATAALVLSALRCVEAQSQLVPNRAGKRRFFNGLVVFDAETSDCGARLATTAYPNGVMLSKSVHSLEADFRFDGDWLCPAKTSKLRMYAPDSSNAQDAQSLHSLDVSKQLHTTGSVLLIGTYPTGTNSVYPRHILRRRRCRRR